MAERRETLLPALADIHPDRDTGVFWDACRRRELRLQRCSDCGRFRQPPLPGCPRCGSARSDWPRLAGSGRVFSYTVVHHAAVPDLAADVPYTVVVVELDGAPDARLISNLVEAPPETAFVGMPVELVWDEPRPGVVLPRFRPARAST
jgi:uncharacterized OB-fold protein